MTAPNAGIMIPCSTKGGQKLETLKTRTRSAGKRGVKADQKEPGMKKPTQKRKDVGGPWRAFVHIMLKGVRFTTALLQAASRSYRLLTDEAREAYVAHGAIAK